MEWKATGVDAHATGRWHAARVEQTPLILTWHQDGWLAVEDRCSHAGCAFSTDGELEATTLICNCHGSEFDLRTGEVLATPARAPLRTFRTRVVEGIVEVEL